MEGNVAAVVVSVVPALPRAPASSLSLWRSHTRHTTSPPPTRSLGLHIRQPTPKQRPRVPRVPRLVFPEDRAMQSMLKRKPQVSLLGGVVGGEDRPRMKRGNS